MRYISCVVDPKFEGSPVWRILELDMHISQAMTRSAKYHEQAILVDNKPARLLSPVHAGQTVSMDVSDSWRDCEDQKVVPQPGSLDILYEDPDLLVLNKPAGIVVHPSPGHRDNTLGNYVMQYLLQTDPDCKVLNPVHRLDIGTTGVLVFAKHSHARNRLQDFMGTDVPASSLDNLASSHWDYAKSQADFCNTVPREKWEAFPAKGVFKRTYLALCCGIFERFDGVVDAPIRRIEEFGLRREVSPQGKRAITHYHVIKTVGSSLSLVALQLVTGRTHQIRVHMEHIGHPLVGDELYNSPLLALDHPALHSWRLTATQPITGELLKLEAPLPSDFKNLLDIQ